MRNAVGAARMVGGSHPEGTIVFLNFGTGLAAGIVVDGVVQHGFSGAAGEIGHHIPIDPNRFRCPCEIERLS
ncbi:MAG: ROK family protein [Bifidobacterium bifidum]